MGIRQGFVYIMGNRRPTLYVGVTSNLLQRVHQHKEDCDPMSFTARYNLHNLLYYEVYDTIEQAIIREKQMKDMNRFDKLALIQKNNPEFLDITHTIFD